MIAGIRKYLTVRRLFFICFIFFFCSFQPVYGLMSMLQDTIVQVKSGEYILEHGFISEDVFSWHEGLSWVSHSNLWYVLVALIYRAGGILGLVIAGSVLNFIIFIFPAIWAERENNSYLSFVLAIILAATRYCLPITNIRPQLISIAVLSYFIFTLCSNYSYKRKALTFLISVYVIAWFHGGTISVIFLIALVYIAIDLICYRKLKKFGISIAVVVLGFLISLLQPCGISIWTFSYKVGLYPELTKTIQEWMPDTLPPIYAIAVICIILGLAMDRRTLSKEPLQIFKVALLCGFLIGTFVYVRMALYFTVVLLYFAPSAIDNFIKWTLSFFKISFKKLYSLKKYLSTVVAVVFLYTIGLNIYMVYTLHGSTFDDVSKEVGFDLGVIETIKEKGYKKIYNDYNIGSWLLYYDIKVHIDNRFDPYVKAFSGEDHLHNAMTIDNIIHLDEFCEKYHPDAVVIEYPNKKETLRSGETYETSDKYALLIKEMDTYGKDKYIRVYTNEGEEQLFNWYIYECVYNE